MWVQSLSQSDPTLLLSALIEGEPWDQRISVYFSSTFWAKNDFEIIQVMIKWFSIVSSIVFSVASISLLSIVLSNKIYSAYEMVLCRAPVKIAKLLRFWSNMSSDRVQGTIRTRPVPVFWPKWWIFHELCCRELCAS